MYCTIYRASDATVSIPDINIKTNVKLTDLSGSKYFYALASTLQEYYPKAANESMCDGLDLTDLPVLTPFDTFFQTPSNLNQGIPTAVELVKYLNNGKPVVIKGQTLSELSTAADF